jgi:RNA polymerase sigma-70 factor (ECF subfamily)
MKHVPPHLTLVMSNMTHERPNHRDDEESKPIPLDVDWSILMARGQVGDRDSYRRLLEQITPYLRSVAQRSHRNKSDVEDAVQDILLTIHAIRVTYDPTRPFGPWLLAIANRRIIDGLRRQGRRRLRETALTPEHESMPMIHENVYEKLNDQQLDNALKGLSLGQRQAIELLKLKEMSLKEAAATTGLSVAALKVTTHRALKNLRKILNDKDEL